MLEQQWILQLIDQFYKIQVRMEESPMCGRKDNKEFLTANKTNLKTFFYNINVKK